MAAAPAPTVLHGRGVSPGTACAPVVRLGAAIGTSPSDPVGAEPEQECARIDRALAAVAAELERRAAAAGGTAAEVLEAASGMALDPTLADRAKELVRGGSPTGHAVTLAAGSFAAQLEELGGYFAERAGDVRDIGVRAVAQLAGVEPPGIPAPGHPVVLTAPDLSPADTATLAGSDVVALLTEQGGPTSHTAILARSLGLPAVVGCPDAATIAAGTVVLLDGTTGEVELEPGDESIARARSRTPADGAADDPGATADGTAVALLTNIGTEPDALAAAAGPTEGVGLFRTEFLFLNRTDRPTLAEQRDIYTRILTAFGDRRVVVRTLDAGSDKPLPFLQLDEEENPALGVRGLRTATRDPELLDEQLRALAEASRAAGRPVDVMAPMVATVQEAQRFADTARAAGLDRVGIMIEVPAAALRAAELMAAVDFVSIGTNDLGQYTMAADRQSGPLGDLLDPWQPALLDLIDVVGRAGRETGRPVGVCGEAAADPSLAAVLVGLGVRSLSTAGVARPAVHAALAGVTLDDCVHVAGLARSAPSPEQGRAAVAEFLGTIR
ncbi:phosphoenolpyruvate--protein phosphotransferase [Pseudonocardia sp. HH130630-07]|uniref:phosphoenolpyruvate--protein phosphotransferase n=1 Tax=Pseudonocardia sp. HH130630-07 TaxID=1690815 RepID=UPI000814FDF4|nr:phosphoenolpyruvate--protein phosphotransferase [Pseudonocardia sp. HH130630-07]ANY09071.1 phosphoenolpyruvate--protein phosphotransferase [Pseudonocardia sp. HH130630-07]